jgi:phage baseplate assembly protein W
MTALGERVMRPTFGCDAVRLVFAPGSVQYLRLLETSVREAVRDWEPRVQLEDVAAETIPGDETRVNVSINYRVRGSNTRNNLVFPFYLGQVEVNT